MSILDPTTPWAHTNYVTTIRLTIEPVPAAPPLFNRAPRLSQSPNAIKHGYTSFRATRISKGRTPYSTSTSWSTFPNWAVVRTSRVCHASSHEHSRSQERSFVYRVASRASPSALRLVHASRGDQVHSCEANLLERCFLRRESADLIGRNLYLLSLLLAGASARNT